VIGQPESPTPRRSATLTVGGPGLFSYRYRVNGSAWSPELPIGRGFDPAGTVRTAQIQLSGLADGQYAVEVQGRDFAGNWQPAPTVVPPWTVVGDLGKLVINEVLAINHTVLNDVGTRPDLIELHNAGAAPVSLRGMSLSDNPDQPRKFVFQNDVVIPADGYLTVMADDRSGDGIHTGFALSGEGETVYLFRSDGRPLDAVEFGVQVPDRSIGRVGSTGQWALTVPSFGRANQAARTGDASLLRINEWAARPATGEDFVELVNLDSLPVSLGGMWLSDAGDGTPARHPIAPLSFVAANGLAVFYATGRADERSDHLNFALAARPETLTLSDSELRPLDVIAYGPQSTGYSQGRLPDGNGGAWTSFAAPSPGWANGAAIPGDFSQDGRIDLVDVELLCAGIRSESHQPPLDLNRDQQINVADMRYLIEVVIGTNFGDTNLNGIFNSEDLVLTFQAGQYEDGLPSNSTWVSGDWNCDGDFGTQDLVIAFQAGAYSAAAMPRSVLASDGGAWPEKAEAPPVSVAALALARADLSQIRGLAAGAGQAQRQPERAPADHPSTLARLGYDTKRRARPAILDGPASSGFAAARLRLNVEGGDVHPLAHDRVLASWDDELPWLVADRQGELN
jgi:hypothetical protein